MPREPIIPSDIAAPERDFRIDVFRGLSLWLIYIDHIPNDFLNRLTPRNFGFSDAAEMFIFLSGLTCGLVYGKLAMQEGLLIAAAHALRRTWQIYVATIFLFAIYAAEVFYFAAGRSSLLDATNIAVFLQNPGPALLQATILRYTPVNTDALSLIVILHFALPAILFGLLKYPRTTVLASFLLYTLAHLFDWSLSAYPRGWIYFNPLDWQLLFVLGVWCGLDGIGSITTLLRSRLFTAVCLGYIALSLVLVIGWQFPALQVPLPEAVIRVIYPINKSSLDPLRLLHFFALAAVIWRFIPGNLSVLRARALLPIIRCGEYSLAVYCLSVLLAFAAQVVLTDLSGGIAAQFLVAVGGVAIMVTVATLLAKADRASSEHPKTI